MLRTSAKRNITGTYTVAFGDFLLLMDAATTLTFPASLPDGMQLVVRLATTDTLTFATSGGAQVCLIGAFCTAAPAAVTADHAALHFVYHEPLNAWYEI